ncbi:MAG: hypothetical protein KBS76_05995 [Ruminococcus sp.]|nr:hypothetical protein [Candidatus Apopatosoma intestinale]
MILKGYTKNLIVVRNLENPLIDEAYLILKRGALRDAGEDDIVREANRILSGCEIPARKKAPPRGAVCFLFGAVLSAAVFSFFYYILPLL